MDRPQLPTKSTAETSPVLPERSPPPNATEAPQVRPPRAVFSMIPAPDTREVDREATISPTDQREENSTSPRNSLVKRRLSDDSQTGDENPMIPSHFPPNPIARPDRACDVFWRNACMEVQRPDGSVHAPDVIRRLMTKKGGIARPWPQLEEGLAVIKAMKKDTIDPAGIFRRQEEEEATARAKEERRLANKRRYRPRGQIDRERAERQAALAALKTKELESDGASRNPQESSA
ncbi:hypothetical protein FIE12Z_6763 [Fusarium flagelliforme]|uniref:Uncharacterized protein n=1 Tax=Fusarium flagelliforme TaxID=2675880 RepID=A0A395MM09_9HYPO|nr:hypothetical protein FIE12Z_6763 [Fusarium flagelliforme]